MHPEVSKSLMYTVFSDPWDSEINVEKWHSGKRDFDILSNSMGINLSAAVGRVRCPALRGIGCRAVHLE